MGRNIPRNIGIHFNEVTEKSASDSEQTKLSKTAGLEKVSPRLIKDGTMLVTSPLTHMIILIMSTGEISEDLKSTRMMPCYKKE